VDISTTVLPRKVKFRKSIGRFRLTRKLSDLTRRIYRANARYGRKVAVQRLSPQYTETLLLTPERIVGLAWSMVKRGFHPKQRTQRKERKEMTSLLDRPIAAASDDGVCRWHAAKL